MMYAASHAPTLMPLGCLARDLRVRRGGDSQMSQAPSLRSPGWLLQPSVSTFPSNMDTVPPLGTCQARLLGNHFGTTLGSAPS